jgi:PleD family two-component response regulator
VEENDWEKIGPGLKVTVSMGLCDNAGLDNCEKMLAEADRSMYRAKKLGGNKVVTAAETE